MKKILVLTIISLVVICGGLYLATHRSKPTLAPAQTPSSQTTIAGKDPTKQEFADAIRNQSADTDVYDAPNLVASYKKVIDRWYIVTVNVASVDGNTSLAVVRIDNDDSLTLIQGPAAYFNLTTLQRFKVPQAVINQLPQEDGDDG